MSIGLGLLSLIGGIIYFITFMKLVESTSAKLVTAIGGMYLFVVAYLLIFVADEDGLGYHYFLATYSVIIFLSTPIALAFGAIGEKMDSKIRLQKVKEKAHKEYEEYRKQREQEELKQRKRAERERKAKFFDACLKRNIQSINYDDEKMIFMMIAKQYGITDFEEAKSLFEKGKKAKAAESAEEEKTRIKNEKGRAMHSGIAKYQAIIKPEIKRCEEEIEKLEPQIKNVIDRQHSLVSASFAANMIYSVEQPVKEDNWAVHGGIANAIAGPAAGLATAMDIQRSNAQAKANAEKDRYRRAQELNSIQTSIKSADQKLFAERHRLDSMRSDYNYTKKRLTNYLEKLDEKIIDESDPQTKFELLSFSGFTCDLHLSGNIEVKGQYNLKQTPSIATVRGFLDGSLKLTVVDKTNTPVAIGYYAGIFSPTTSRSAHKSLNDDLSNGSFGIYSSEKRNISALCAAVDGKPVSNSDGLTVQVEPVHMWIIEQ